MSIKGKDLKNSLLGYGKKIGLLIEEGSDADRVITRGTKVAAIVATKAQRNAKVIGREAKAAIEDLRADIHAATAPRRKSGRK